MKIFEYKVVKVPIIVKENAYGLIEEGRAYYDTTEFRRQLGLIEP